MPTQNECKRLLSKLGLKLGASPNLISTRLLSNEDKEDMLAGLIDDHMLECHVKVWIEARMPDYANGHTEPYTPQKEIPMQMYRGMGKR